MTTTPHAHIGDFLDYLKFQKRYSQHTIISYKNDLTSFFDYLELQFNEQQLTNIKSTYVRSWLAELKGANNSSKTINRKISALKTFFKYQLKKNHISVSPMTTVVSPKLNKRLPEFVDNKDISTLFDYVEFPDDWSGRTARLLLLLLYSCGIRQAELIGLKEDQVDYSKNSIKVLGKGSKERIIPVSKELIASIQE